MNINIKIGSTIREKKEHHTTQQRRERTNSRW